MSMDPAAGTGISSCGVVSAGAAAGKVPMAAAAVAPGAVVVAAAPPAGALRLGRICVRRSSSTSWDLRQAPAAAKPSLNWKNLRRRWAQTLFVLGCAAAALAFFSISSSSSTADSRRLLGACAPTDAEAAALGACAAPADAEAAVLRNASKNLLVFAAAQLLAATTTLLVPAAPRQVAIFLSLVGWQTGYRAAKVLLMLFERHGRVDGVVVTSYYILEVLALVGYFVGSAVVDSSY